MGSGTKAKEPFERGQPTQANNAIERKLRPRGAAWGQKWQRAPPSRSRASGAQCVGMTENGESREQINPFCLS